MISQTASSESEAPPLPRRRTILAHELCACCILAAVAFGGSDTFGQPAPLRVNSPAGTGAFREDRILIKPAAGVTVEQLASIHARHGARVLRTFRAMDNIQVLRIPSGAGVPDLIQRYQQSALIELAGPDFLLHAAVTEPNDPRFANGTLWGLKNTGQNGGIADADIDAPEGWDTLTSAGDIIVAVIDSGVRYTHEDLAANMWVNPGESGLDVFGEDKRTNGIDDDGNGYIDDVHGINAINDSGDPMDDYGHGTHVAGVLGAVGNNGLGVVGVAWEARILGCKFIDGNGDGATSDAIQCIDYAISKEASVINASWGNNQFDQFLRNAVTRARDAGIIFVTVAGNGYGSDNDVTSYFPANYDADNIVVVASTTRTDALAAFSNFGATTVDVGAPGDAIYSTWFNDDSGYTYNSGTSMSAPYVSGVFALMRARNPSGPHQQLISLLLAATDPVPGLAGKCVSGGRVNLHKAIGPGPVADFAAMPMAGPLPLTVSFTNTSFGDVTNLVWDFANGARLTNDSSPSIQFTNEGNYEVSLTVGGSSGSSSKTRLVSAVANYNIESASFDWIGTNGFTRLFLSDNGVSPARSLPFTFYFYGQAYQRIYVGANGMLGFINQGLNSTANVDLPNASAPNAVICPYWDDLNPADNGGVWVGTSGAAPTRRVVVSWVDVPLRLPGGPRLTFQAALEEGTQTILFQYLEVQPDRSAGAARQATVGLENETGLVAARYTHNGAPELLANNQSIRFVPSTGGGIVVTPATSLSASGNTGGPFSPSDQSFAIQNIGNTIVNWTAGNEQSWLSLSPTNGVLTPGQITNVIATTSTHANDLGEGSYLDTISFANANGGIGNTTRSFALTVNGLLPGVLSVSPDTDLSASGFSGGPFSPDTRIYTLHNSGGANLDWTAENDQPWLSLSDTNGALASGESATVTASLNTLAADLIPGGYTDTVSFADQTSGSAGFERMVALIVRPYPLLSVTGYNSNQFQLQLIGEPGKTYTIEASTNLLDWLAVFTNSAAGDGSLDFADEFLTNSNSRFYRAVLGP